MGISSFFILQVLVLGTTSLTFLVIGFGLGVLVKPVLSRFAQVNPGAMQTWLVGVSIGVGITALFGVLGANTLWVGISLLSGGGIGLIVWLWPNRHRIEGSMPAVRRSLVANRGLWIGALVVAIPFVPLFGTGSAYWTLDLNDFPLFSSWVKVWQSESVTTFLNQHPDEWGQIAALGAGIEKPVATAVLGLLSQFSPGPVLAVQNSAFFLTLIMTYVLLTMTVKNLVGRIPLWTGAAIAAVLIGLYPWARVLNGQWGHVLALMFVAGALFWASSTNKSPTPRSSFVYSTVTGLFLGLAFGANYELFTLLILTVAALLISIHLLKGGHDAWITILGWITGSMVASSFALPGALRVLDTWQAIPTDQLENARPEIAFPSPLALIGLQTAYGSISQWQAIALWLVVLVVGACLWWSVNKLKGGAVWINIIGVGTSLIFLSQVFGIDQYSTGKYVSAAIPLVGTLAITGLVALYSSWLRAAVVVPVAITSAAISFYWANSLPILIPRDLLALTSSPALTSIAHINLDLGNPFENHAAALIVPTQTITVVDAGYGGTTYATAPYSLVRVDAPRSLLHEEVLPLNDTYGILLLDDQGTS